MKLTLSPGQHFGRGSVGTSREELRKPRNCPNWLSTFGNSTAKPDRTAWRAGRLGISQVVKTLNRGLGLGYPAAVPAQERLGISRDARIIRRALYGKYVETQSYTSINYLSSISRTWHTASDRLAGHRASIHARCILSHNSTRAGVTFSVGRWMPPQKKTYN